MEDKKPKSGRGQDAGLGGLRAPAKGDSAPSGVPLENEGMTFIEPPKPPAKPPAKPPTKPPTKLPAEPGGTVVNANLTLDGSNPTQAASGGRSYSGMYREVVLQSGDILGGRYEILELLGEGGMGAVYKAQDREVDRFIALKLIRPELASNPAILARFKQELLTAHQVTHKNVIRIYDIAEADGVKFITMEFVEGHDLRRFLLDDGRLPPEKAVEIVRQICLALDAAHSAGIIHRDLKPQNVMLDKQGRILVMDFGLARQVESEGMTQTGALLGTIEYMSPEQAMGKPLDQRSDLFALGLIFYELLTGKMPYKAETAMASLLKRNQDRAIPATEIDATIPKGLSDIVAKCLERDLTLRYQSANEILADLDAWEGKRPINASIVIPPPKQPFPWKWVAPGALAVILAAGGVAFKDKIFKNTPAGPTTTATVPQLALAILPFHNATTDTSLDWLGTDLADTLSTDVGQSAHMHTVSPNRIHQIFTDLRIAPNADIDPDALRNIVEQSNADTVVYGKYAKFGNQIQIDATLHDIKGNRQQALKIVVSSEQEIPAKIDELAELIRKNLALSSDVVKELKASSFQPSSKSVEALKAYNQSMQLVRDGKNLEAVKLLESAIQNDPQFALAYSKLAETDSTLGYDADAERYSRKAMDLSQQLPAAEKYLIEANHARIIKDNKKAIEAYENLAKIMPDNSDVEYALGSLYSEKGDYDKARTQFSKILLSDPKNIKALWQMGVVEIMKDNPQAALEPLNKGLSMAIQVDNQEQKALIMLSMGISYRLMNKPEEALRNYEQSIAINEKIGQKRGVAAAIDEMAQVQMTMGKSDMALASYERALKLRREIGAKKEVGNTLLDVGSLYQARGQYDKALQNYKESLQIQRDTGDENYQALSLTAIGTLYLAKGDTDNALTYLQQALQLREKLNVQGDIADTVAALGEVYSTTGKYDEALTFFIRALDLWRKAGDKHGAAVESHQIGLVFRYQGRLGAALGAMQDAVKGSRETGNQGLEMVQFLTDLADTMALAGRGDESGKLLEEAQAMARDLKNQTVHAEVLNAQGDVQFYRGDLNAAKSLYDQALRSASKGADHDEVLISKLNLASVAIAKGQPASTIPALRDIMQQADSLNLKHLSVESSLAMAEAMISTKDYKQAREELDRTLGRSEKLGARLETARIHYLLGRIMQLTGSGSEAAGQYQQAVSLLNQIKGEPGAEKVLQRPDLKIVYDDSTRGSQHAKS
jgi:tetratricopeptide (TPR) repeat protein/predicted Ser/Thr protein kinase